MRRFQLLDATLREGEQRAGVRFHYEEKRAIVGLLERFGVDLIEIGHPGISAEDEDICTRVAASASRAEILMHARAQPDEVRAVARRAPRTSNAGTGAGFSSYRLRPSSSG